MKLLLIFLLLFSSQKVAKKYLVTIHEGRNNVEVFKTDNISAIDSIMVSYGLPRIADTILRYSPFFEIRVDGVTIYAERKIK